MHRLSLSVRLVPPCTVPASPSPEVDNGEILWVQAFSHIDVSSEACPFFFFSLRTPVRILSNLLGLLVSHRQHSFSHKLRVVGNSTRPCLERTSTCIARYCGSNLSWQAEGGEKSSIDTGPGRLVNGDYVSGSKVPARPDCPGGIRDSEVARRYYYCCCCRSRRRRHETS